MSKLLKKAIKGLRKDCQPMVWDAKNGLNWGAAKRNALLHGEDGSMRELVGVVVGLTVIIIMVYTAIFMGDKLENAAQISPGSHWDNMSNATGEMAEDSIDMIGVGILIVTIFASVGFIIWPYIQGGGRGGE